MEQLYIHLATPVRWLLWHPSQQEVIASGELNDASELAQLHDKAQRSNVTVLVPGQDVLLTEVRLPAGSQRLLPQLIPNSLEDELASDIDGLHFAWPASAKPSGVEQPIPVTVVSKAHMQEWLSALQQADIEADVIYPDYFALPAAEQAVQLRLGASLLVREGQWQAYSTDVPPLFDIAATDLTDNYELPLQVAAAGALPATINLRQGEYRVARKRRKQSLSVPWKPAAIAAGVALVAVFAQQFVTYVQLGQENQQLQAAIESTYREAFPNTTRIVNVRSQLRQQLASIGGNASATTDGTEGQPGGLAMLAQLETAFRATPSVELDRVRYNQGTLQLQVNAADFEELQSFQEAANNTGLNVSQGQVTNQNGVVSGAIEVTAGEGV